MSTYFLRIRSPRVIGTLDLRVTTRNAAIALAKEWQRIFRPVEGLKLEVTDSEGVTQWTLQPKPQLRELALCAYRQARGKAGTLHSTTDMHSFRKVVGCSVA